MTMTTSRIETLVWVLIYGGLLAVGLGIAVQRTNAALGWGLVLVGGLAAVLGVVLIWVRSRMTKG